MKNKILVFISNSQGELDWVLPIIVEFSKRKFKVDLYIDAYDDSIIIKRKKNIHLFLEKYNIKVYNKTHFSSIVRSFKLMNIFFFNSKIENTIKKILNKISFLFFNMYYKRYSNKIYNFFKSDIFLKDLGTDSKLRLELSKLFSNHLGKVILFPHGTEIFIEDKPEEKSFNGDLLLASSFNVKNYYKKKFKGIPISVIGIPRYDPKWISTLKKEIKFKENTNSKFKILFITRGPHPTDLSKKDFLYLVNSISSICENSNIQLLVRSHPRYSKALLSNIFITYKNLDWKFEDDNLVTISNDLNLVVAMWSTMILDALVLKIPVIEFFKCGNKRIWSKNSSGSSITGYEKNKIVISAKSKHELKTFINEIMIGDLDKVNKTFFKFDEIFNLNESSIDNSINAITNN